MEGSPDRWAENSVGVSECDEKTNDISTAPTPARNASVEKENRYPLSARKKDSIRGTSPRGTATVPTTPGAATLVPRSIGFTPPATAPYSASVSSLGPLTATTEAPASADAKQRQRDLRLASQLDLVRDELKQRSRENKELQLSHAAKDRKLEELQRKLEELAAERREAQRRIVEAESEKAAQRRQLHEKEQDLLALQRKLDHVKQASEERSKRAERRDEEQRNALVELQRVKTSMEVLQDRLTIAERAKGLAEQGFRQQQKTSQELETGLQAHIAVLEESLNREVARRRELEAKDSSRQQEEQDVAQARRHIDELQGRVNQLQSELTSKLANDLQRSDEINRLEEELCHVKAKLQAEVESSKRIEAQRSSSEARAARAEAALEASSADLARERSRVAELDEECHRFGEAQYLGLHEKVEAAEKRIKELTQELADERARSEALERQCAVYHEKEEAALRLAESERQARLSDPTYRALEARALRAEAEAEEARENLQRWKEWGDEQQLRELTAEGERLEKIKQVREEVTRQVEDARLELVAENRALHQRIIELENGSSSSLQISTAERERLAVLEKQLKEQATDLAARSAQLMTLEAELGLEKRAAERNEDDLRRRLSDADAARTAVEERCQVLEARAARAEAAASVSADEFAEERERFEERVRELNRQLVEVQSSSSADMIQRVDEVTSMKRSVVATTRWQLLIEAYLSQHERLSQEAAWVHIRKAARQWRSAGSSASRDNDRLNRQESELERLDSENERLREQNAQALQTLQMLQFDFQSALAETKRLQEREAAYESDMLRINERSAELGGHSNPKQKIKHLMAVKDENQSLRQELKKNQQLVAQLQSQLRAAQFFENSFAPAPRNEAEHLSVVERSTRTQTPRRRQAAPSTPGRPLPRKQGGQGAVDCRENDDRADRAEQLRLARAHQRASETAANEYQHLYALIERALATEGNTSTASDQKDLYRRLREMSPKVSGGITPTGTTSAVVGDITEQRLSHDDSVTSADLDSIV